MKRIIKYLSDNIIPVTVGIAIGLVIAYASNIFAFELLTLWKR